MRSRVSGSLSIGRGRGGLPLPSKTREGVGRAPDYVGLGVQRSGTTRWHSLIVEHPDAAQIVDRKGRVTKETHWFRDLSSDSSDDHTRDYLSWFDAPADKIVGEFTPRYLYDRWPVTHLRQHFPSLKLLVFLRDPMTRLESAIRFYEQRGWPVDDEMVSEAIDRGMYSGQLEHLFAEWPREQVFVELYETCNEAPGRVLARMYEFLDLDPSFVPPNLDSVVNASTEPEVAHPQLTHAMELFAQDREPLGVVLPDIDLSGWI